MDRVKPVRRTQEVRRALARAADARELDDLRGVDAQLEKRVDDALGDGVVAATGAQRRLAAAVRNWLEPDSIEFLARRCRWLCWCRHGLPALLLEQFIGNGTAIDRQSDIVSNAAKLGELLRVALHLEQRQH